jgi:hypothetical protein
MEGRELDIDIFYKSHSIIREKVELYYDFLYALIDIIEETYLGDDVVKTEEEMKQHFKWCFEKVISNFEQEKIYFKQTGKFFDFFWLFFLDTIYMGKEDDIHQKLKNFISIIFNFKYDRTDHELNVLLEMYKLMDQNLKN